jgi:hypothetical protein
MWSAHPDNGGDADLFCITTNSFIRNDGSLVMGAGIARQARDKLPGLAQNVGNHIEENVGHLNVYGLLLPETRSALAFFQVKQHWRNNADVQLIIHSSRQLKQWVESRPQEPDVHLNYPGIGNGGLDRGDVAPIVTAWPSNVHVWTYR